MTMQRVGFPGQRSWRCGCGSIVAVVARDAGAQMQGLVVDVGVGVGVGVGSLSRAGWATDG